MEQREGKGKGKDQPMMAEELSKALSMPRSNKNRQLSKQLSMRETTREAKWERRRRQILLQRKRMKELGGGVLEEEEEEEETAAKAAVVGEGNNGRVRSLTDEDLDELRGSIELGFGFSEDGSQKLCDTLPALDLYFAVNRQLSDLKFGASPSPVSTPTTPSSSSEAESPSSQHSAWSSDSLKILSPGDDPEEVKTRLRHWAQVVACSLRQCCRTPNEQVENGLR